MRNLKDETLEHISRHNKTILDIDYCYIYEANVWSDTQREYCKGEFNDNALDFKYDDGYGGQEVDGFIVYKDGTWSERGEYDGSEWWDYKSVPQLKKENK